ncbi:FHA domain-containing protein [Streptomyces sp. AC495_CC817]|uniref:FHA domain-containing protein n=1 Tax=Streptomyces sp. AC495_CC817 TaxID=2823900 RepID=UPI001C25CC34|nr:FHA domain-containing protein [Streptomyces sp. AC495_CC817]
MDDRYIDDRPDHGYTPTTTHAEWGAGSPHLRITRDDERTEFPLDADLVRIGSSAGNELVLSDTDPVHATITHDDRDEYVLELHGEGEMNSNPDAAATHPGGRTETLRTGSRFTAGPWTLVFGREEFADHGRPYGGRLGGEYSDQPVQPPRPDYGDDARAAAESGTGSPAPTATGTDAGHSDSTADA